MSNKKKKDDKKVGKSAKDYIMIGAMIALMLFGLIFMA